MQCPKCNIEIPQNSTACHNCGHWFTIPYPDTAAHERNWSWILALVTLVSVGLAVNLADRGADLIEAKLGPPPDFEEFVPDAGEVSVNLIPATLEVRANQTYETRFRMNTARMRAVHVIGRYSVSANAADQIQFLLADDKNYRKWKDNLPANLLFVSRAAKDVFDVPLTKGGTYHLVFANANATEVSLTCDAKLEYRFKAR